MHVINIQKNAALFITKEIHLFISYQNPPTFSVILFSFIFYHNIYINKEYQDVQIHKLNKNLYKIVQKKVKIYLYY